MQKLLGLFLISYLFTFGLSAKSTDTFLDIPGSSLGERSGFILSEDRDDVFYYRDETPDSLLLISPGKDSLSLIFHKKSKFSWSLGISGSGYNRYGLSATSTGIIDSQNSNVVSLTDNNKYYKKNNYFWLGGNGLIESGNSIFGFYLSVSYGYKQSTPRKTVFLPWNLSLPDPTTDVTYSYKDSNGYYNIKREDSFLEDDKNYSSSVALSYTLKNKFWIAFLFNGNYQNNVYFNKSFLSGNNEIYNLYQEKNRTGFSWKSGFDMGFKIKNGKFGLFGIYSPGLSGDKIKDYYNYYYLISGGSSSNSEYFRWNINYVVDYTGYENRNFTGVFYFSKSIKKEKYGIDYGFFVKYLYIDTDLTGLGGFTENSFSDYSNGIQQTNDTGDYTKYYSGNYKFFEKSYYNEADVKLPLVFTYFYNKYISLKTGDILNFIYFSGMRENNWSMVTPLNIRIINGAGGKTDLSMENYNDIKTNNGNYFQSEIRNELFFAFIMNYKKTFTKVYLFPFDSLNNFVMEFGINL